MFPGTSLKKLALVETSSCTNLTIEGLLDDMVVYFAAGMTKGR